MGLLFDLDFYTFNGQLLEAAIRDALISNNVEEVVQAQATIRYSQGSVLATVFFLEQHKAIVPRLGTLVETITAVAQRKYDADLAEQEWLAAMAAEESAKRKSGTYQKKKVQFYKHVCLFFSFCGVTGVCVRVRVCLNYSAFKRSYMLLTTVRNVNDDDNVVCLFVSCRQKACLR